MATNDECVCDDAGGAVDAPMHHRLGSWRFNLRLKGVCSVALGVAAEAKWVR